MVLICACALLLYQTVDSILDRYVDSVGGRQAMERIETRITRGEIVTSAGSVPFVIHQKAPDRFLVSIDAIEGNSKNGFDGKNAWSKTPGGQLRDVSGPEVELFKRDYSLRREIRLREMYSSFRLKTTDSEAYIVEAESTGVPDLLYFNKSTGLLIRMDVNIQGMVLQTFFEDYRLVDGVVVPFLIRRSRPGFTWSYKVDAVQHNSRIEDAVFAKPSGVIMQDQ